ncbi:MAG TPA: hypothetical protein VGX28_10565 [Frankiaceae bacterium]|jgi:hypothetical protein|nr:hypothetical protein [Frankiaceae bacterium]
MSVGEDREKTRLGFVDVLFAIAVGKTLELTTQPKMSAAGLAQLLVAGITTLLSYVGYRNSSSRTDQEMDPLRNGPFYHFVIDVFLVYLYFLLAASSESPGESPTATDEAVLIALVFLAYVAWDALALWMRRSGRLEGGVTPSSVRRMKVSVWCFAASGVVLAAVWIREPDTRNSVVLVDAVLLVLALAYRVLKGPSTRVTGTPPPGSGTPTGG